MDEQNDVVLEVQDIVKQFPGVLANDHVSLKLHRGEILALLGENGAGKSTLMNIIYGLYHPDQGTIRLKGREVHFASPREAIHSGIGMVHQHFQLVPVMTVAENVVLGEEADVAYQGKENPLLRWVLKWLPSIVIFLLIAATGWLLGETRTLIGGLIIGLAAAALVAVPPLARLLWGLTWRIGLVLVALWIATRIEIMATVGLMDVALRQEVETLSRERDPKVMEGPIPYAVKSRTVEKARVEFDWSQSALAVSGEEDEVAATVALAKEAMAPYRDDGIPGWMIDAIDSVPPWIYLFSGMAMILVIGGGAIRSWRGFEQTPVQFRLADVILVGGLMAVYLVLAATRLMNVEQGYALSSRAMLAQVVALLALGFGLLLVFYRTWRRRDDPDELLQVSPLDSALDAFLNALNTATQIRNTRAAAQRVRELSQQYGLEVDPDVVIEKLPVGTQQRVEIVKALYRKADILILDEPTAVLTPQESKELFKIMRQLAAQGVSIIFITHKLKEVFEVATHIVVMRGGQVVGTTTPDQATESSLASMMVGREVILQVEKGEARPGAPVLEARGLEALNDRGAPALNGVSFDVCAGEVLGIAGVQGNGQTELVEVLTGLRDLTGGSVRLLGMELQPEVQPRAGRRARLVSFVIDTALMVLAAYFVGALVAYFGEETFRDTSTVTRLLVGAVTLLAVDALYFLGSWAAFGGTFGMSCFGLELVDARDKKPNLARLVGYYLAFLALRPVLLVLTPLALVVSGPAASVFERLDSWFRLHVIRREYITPRRVKDLGTSHVPEDRQRHGLVKLYSVADNLVLNDYYERPFAKEPNAAELPFALLRYAVVVGLIVAGLMALAVWVWDQWLWTAILDAYRVPDHLRTIVLNQGLSSDQKAVLRVPFILSVLLLIGAALLSGVIAHGAASALFRLPPVQTAIRRVNQSIQRMVWRLQGEQGDPPEARGGLLRDRAAVDRHARRLIKEYDIRTPSPDTLGGSLSGGNQQKMIVAREFSRKPRLLIAAQPTRGIDVGSIEFIHRQIIDQRDAGAAVLLVSAELDEIMSLSDRIAVMYKGQIIDTVPASEATREQLGLLMAGIRSGARAPERVGGF